MLMVLSPAKSLDYTTPVRPVACSDPEFAHEAGELIKLLRGYSPVDLAQLMSVSDKLAVLNAARYAAFSDAPAVDTVRAAVLAFDGDVYDGLNARTLDAPSLDRAQQRVRILSGLYGVLRPLDALQPYRLEMGTRLANSRGRDLYAFWGDQPAQSLRRAMAHVGARTLVNLASEEYFKAVDVTVLGWPIVQPVFQEWRETGFKVISFAAKRARGAMVRFALDHDLRDATALQAFDGMGYQFDAQASDAQTWYFRRR